MPKDERIGGAETIPVLPPGGHEMPDRTDEQLLTPVVLRELLITQRGLQDEARGITTVLNTMAVSLAKIEVKVEPVATLQRDIAMHENRLTKVEQQAVDNRQSFDNSFKVMVAVFGGAVTGGGVILAYILSHVKWG